LLAVEAFGIVENEMAKLEKEGTSKQLQGLRDSAHESRNSVQEALRLTLGNIGGTGYSAEIGKITQLAAYEEKTDKDKSGLRYLAAAGSWGKICLWHIDDKGKYTRTILPFGYAPPIRKLLFTDSGKYLVAHHLRDNVTVWDLTTKDLECRLFEAFPEPREPGLGPAVPGSLFSSSTGKWLEIDDGQSAGMLIHLEDAKAGPRRFDLGLQQIVKAEKPAPVLKYHSFSDDEKWFARITSTGEVYVWDLAALKDGVNRPPVKLQQDAKEKHEPNVQAVNGEFLDKSKRLVVYLGNGRARYWDLNGTSTWGKAEEVNLQTVAGIDVLQKVDTNGRGTHAILIGSAKREKAPNSSSEVVAVCFDGKDLQAGPVRGKQLQDYDWPYHRGRPEIDRTGRWLIVPCASPGKNDRILAWDLGPGEPEGRAAVPRKPQSTSFPGSILEARRVPHSPCLVTRGLGNTIHWLNLLQSQSLLELRGHDAQVTVLAYSQDGRWLVTGSDDGTVRAWNLNPLSPSAEPVVFGASAPQSIRVAPNKRWAALSLPDGSLRFARIIDGTLPKEWIRHRAEKPKGAASLVWSDDGRWLLEHRPESGTASLWDVAGKQPSRTGKRELGITKTVTGMLVNKAGTRLAVQSTNGILLWNLKEHAPHCCALPEAAGTVLAFVSPGDRLLTYDEKAVKVWDLAGQAPQPTSVVSTKDRIKIAHALASADGMRLVIWEKVEDADKLQASLITELREENRRLLQFLQTKDGVFFSPNGEFLGCEAVPPPGSQAQLSFPRYWYIGKLPSDGPIIMHEFRTGDGAAGKAGEALARSPNGKWFVTREGGDAFLWDLLQKPNLAKQFQRSRGLGEVRSAQFTSDSAWLITAGASTISVYDLRQQTRGPQWKLQTTQPQDTIACVALTLTESRSLLAIVVQKDGDTSTTVWDLGKPGNQRPIVLGGGFRPSPPTEMMFNSDATRIVSFFPDRLLVSYCDPDELKARTAIVVGRKLSKDEQKVIDELAEMTPGPDRLSGGELSGQGKFGPTLLKDKLLGKLPAFLPGFNKTETLTSADRELGPQSKPARAYKINMAAKSTYLIDMRSPKFEAYFILKDPDNQVVAWADERGSPPARLGYLCPKSGEYTIVATVFGGGVGEFHLTVAELKPMEPTALIPLGPQGGDIRGHLSTDNDDTGDGPGLVYALQLPKGKLCQLDLTSSTFAPILRLVGDASGAIVADAGNVAGRARIVLNSRQGGAYRVLVIGTRGAPGPFDLRVTLRDPGQ
ncbi:MAG TPA: WD40 repeat domain-containing protein, partial [Gemmataceae bacterium]|nr:WD40 repeat domain-containing protein [Gemmataceae bacterium]